jgi:hypothetical protein
VEGALAQILTAMSTQLGAQTDTLATMNASAGLAQMNNVLGQVLDAQRQVNDTLREILEVLDTERKSAATTSAAAENARKLVEQIDADYQAGLLPKLPPASKPKASKTAPKANQGA